MTIHEFAEKNNIVLVDEAANTYVIMRPNVWKDAEELKAAGYKHSVLGWTGKAPSAYDPTCCRVNLWDVVEFDFNDNLKFNYASIKELYYIGMNTCDADKLNREIIASYDIPVTDDFYIYIYGTPETVEVKDIAEKCEDDIYLIEINGEFYFASNHEYAVPHVKVYMYDFCKFNEYGVIVGLELSKPAKSKIWYTFHKVRGLNYFDEEIHPDIYCDKTKLRLKFIRGTIDDSDREHIVWGHKCVGEDGLDYYFETTENLMLLKQGKFNCTATVGGVTDIDGKAYIHLFDVEIIK